MSCLATAGFLVNCKEGIGGIKAIYIGAYNTFSYSAATPATIDPTTNMVTALATGSVYEFELPKHTGSFTEEGAISIENGTVYYTQTIVCSFHTMTAARSLQLQNISKGRNVIFVQDNNSNIWMCGYKDGAEVTAFTTATGTAKGDLNGYTITFTAEEKDKAYLLDQDAGDTPFQDFTTITIVQGTL
jgi:hypothetical protein